MPHYSDTDTIFALSSANGRAALALHRISGPNARPLIVSCLGKKQGSETQSHAESKSLPELKHSLSKHLFIVDTDGTIIDDCLITFFEGPRSFTGEDVVEISTHGNPLICARLHSLLRRIGMREAKPGEFTQRAFLHGKLDLTRAEAIDQLIHAETQAGLDLARQASEGKIARVAQSLKSDLTSVMAYFEAHIDFADDEVGDYDSVSQVTALRKIEAELIKLADSFSTGLKLREGIKVSFLGTPNAGKSSLYNALLGYERAIVTDIPGTTRDVVEDRLTLHNRDFVLLDTAGVRETDDQVEKIGVSKTLKSAQTADIVCVIVDPFDLDNSNFSSSFKAHATMLLNQLHAPEKQNILYVLTKKDRWSDDFCNSATATLQKLKNENFNITTTAASVLDVGEFIQALENAYDQIMNSGQRSDSAILISKRQHDQAQLALTCLRTAIELVTKKDFPEKVASMLIQSAQHISDVVGEIGTEDILENIFSSFCIGK